MRLRHRRRILGLAATALLLASACQDTAVVAQADPRTAAAPTPASEDSSPSVAPENLELPTPRPAPVATPTPTPPAPPEPPAPPLPTVTPLPTAAPEPTTTPVPTATPLPTATPEPAAAIAGAFAASAVETVSCPADVVAAGVSCMIASVPVDAFDPDPNQLVELMVAVVDNGDPRNAGPVVFLQGGPGVGSVGQAKNFVGAAYDILFVDQRGTGYSLPKLDCPEEEALWSAEYSDDENERLSDALGETIDAYAQCSDRLKAEGVSFDDFNTRAVATDFELIRRLLGYDAWSLWGISYGTRVGLNIMRDHPEGVRAAVLDSVVPFEVDFFATLPENGLRAISALDGACDAAACAESHGDFYDNLTALARQLNQEPAVVSARRPVSGDTIAIRVDGTLLVSMVFSQLYSTRRLGSLPRQISRAEFGGLDEIVSGWVTRRDPERFDLAAGLYYTTWCREEFPFHDPTADDDLLDDTETDFDGSLRGALASDAVAELCEIFDVEAAPPIDDEAVISDIPTLVFAGSFDPITPPQWSRMVAEALTNATFVEMADHGHGMASACPIGIREAFLQSPEGELDTSCAASVSGPSFD